MFGKLRTARFCRDFCFDKTRSDGYDARLMLNQRLPERIDPLRLAETGRTFRGLMELSRFKRLAPSLVSTEGTVEVELEFGIDEAGVRYLSGRLSTEVELICQRCLEPMRFRLTAEPLLGIVADAALAERLPPHYEALIAGERGPLLLQDIIEDELILALPIVPRHPVEACPQADAVRDDEGAEPDSETEEKDNPFAVLAALKRDTRS
jgi:uncharacterized protein